MLSMPERFAIARREPHLLLSNIVLTLGDAPLGTGHSKSSLQTMILWGAALVAGRWSG